MTDTSEGAQLAFEGLPIADRQVRLAGSILLPDEVVDAFTLGQTLDLHVTAQVKGVAGKADRNDWGDDEAHVTWTLHAEEATVA